MSGKDFKKLLVRIEKGQDFVEEIWIDRIVSSSDSGANQTTAQSMTGAQVKNITELLEDDLRHCFDDGFDIFRVVSAFPGSGKTALIGRLENLIEKNQRYKKSSVVSRLMLPDIKPTGGNQTLLVIFYCRILADFFYKLLSDSNSEIRNIAQKLLDNYLGDNAYKLKDIHNDIGLFRMKLTDCFSCINISFKDFFFKVITDVHKVEPRYNFVLLLDELDGLNLGYADNDFSEIASIINLLVREPFRQRHLLIYLVGASENVQKFFIQAPVIKKLFKNNLINLGSGNDEEIKMIRHRIDEQFYESFKGYKNFDKAWEEIKNIQLSATSLRDFCRDYAQSLRNVLYNNNFQTPPTQTYEDIARELIAAECRKKWADYLNQKPTIYSLTECKEPIKIAVNSIGKCSFDCYIELLKNGKPVAKCYGEAKSSSSSLSGDAKKFISWLVGRNFKGFTNDGTPPDLAFLVAPKCSKQTNKKLEDNLIHFIQADNTAPNSDGGKPKSEYENMTKEQLRDIAEKMGIPKIPKNITKDKLIERIEKKKAESAKTNSGIFD